MKNDKIQHCLRFFFLLLLPLGLMQCGGSSAGSTQVESSPPPEARSIAVVPSNSATTATTASSNIESVAAQKLDALEESGEDTQTNSLLAQRSTINQQEAMNQLIRAGTPINSEAHAPQIRDREEKRLPERGEQKLLPYKNLSIFKYLEDLQWFCYEQNKVPTDKLVALSAQERYGSIEHEALAYPLTRMHYWIRGQETSVESKTYRYLFDNPEQELPPGATAEAKKVFEAVQSTTRMVLKAATDEKQRSSAATELTNDPEETNQLQLLQLAEYFRVLDSILADRTGYAEAKANTLVLKKEYLAEVWRLEKNFIKR